MEKTMGAHTSALLVRFGSLPALVHSLITGSRSRMAGMFAVLLLSAAPHVARAVDAVTALQLESGATPTCIGFKWFVAGDDDLDASVSVSFRPTGTSDWQVAQPLLRVEPGIYNEYGVDPGNLLAGSIFGLEPGRAYDVRLVLSDPDGGFATRTVIVTTRPEPADPVLPRLRYVVPGAGGGTGTQTDPFRGIAAANAQALPGDVFLLQPGTYFGVSALTRSGLPGKPIVWKGTDASAVVLDGQDTAKPVVDFSGSQYVHLENVTVRRPRQMAIRGYATTGLVIRDCIVDSSNLTGSEKGGIYLLGPGHTDATITDNVIRGPFHWEDGRNDDAYALIVVGTGHVVAHNEIYDWWDGLTVGHGETDVETSNCDVYGNEVYDCTDDGIETDGSRHNIRIWDNRFTNVLCGISAQPVFGGPVYSIRNVVYDFQLKPLKFQVWPTGLIVFDNTFVGADPRGWGEGQWRNAIVRNNLFIGGSEPGHNGDPIALDTSGIGADFDFNGWYQAIPNRFGRFNGVLYRNLADFQQAMGMSWSAVLLDIGVFVDAEEPPLGPYLATAGTRRRTNRAVRICDCVPAPRRKTRASCSRTSTTATSARRRTWARTNSDGRSRTTDRAAARPHPCPRWELPSPRSRSHPIRVVRCPTSSCAGRRMGPESSASSRDRDDWCGR
ncbi:MAG: right-handed parallel beta-helix repeat-containing protein [Candidatus Eisenbacteria bacterium]